MPWRSIDECALEAGGAAESAGKPGARERTTGQPRRITISTVIEQWNVGEVETIADWCGSKDCFFAAPVRADGENAEFGATAKPKYQALVDKIIERRRKEFSH